MSLVKQLTTSSGSPHKVKIVVDNLHGKQNINAVTGKDATAKQKGQEYLVCPPEHWLSGIPKEDSKELLQITANREGDKSRPPVLRLEVTPKVSNSCMLS